MAYMDFKDLQDQVLSRGYGEADRTRVKAWLNEAAEDLNRERRWSFNETRWTVATVAGTNTISLASLSPSLQYFSSIVPNDLNGIPLSYVEYDNTNPDQPFRNYSTLRGLPQYVTRVSDATLYVYPIPDAVYNYVINGYKRHVQLVADGDTPALPQEHRHVLIHGALKKAAERDKDPTMMSYWREEWQRARSDLLKYDEVGRHQQSTLRASMPSHYHGRFD
jgi:hypothetical protein